MCAGLIEKEWYTDADLNTLNLTGMEAGSSSTPHQHHHQQHQGPGSGSGNGGAGKFNSENGSECSSVTSDSLPAG